MRIIDRREQERERIRRELELQEERRKKGVVVVIEYLKYFFEVLEEELGEDFRWVFVVSACLFVLSVISGFFHLHLLLWVSSIQSFANWINELRPIVVIVVLFVACCIWQEKLRTILCTIFLTSFLLELALILWYYENHGFIGIIMSDIAPWAANIVNVVAVAITPVITAVVGIAKGVSMIISEVILFLGSNVVAIGAVFVAFAALVAQLIRFLRANTLGLPFKLTYITIKESLDIVVVLAVFVGLGVLVPLGVDATNNHEGAGLLNALSGLSSLSVFTALFLAWHFLPKPEGLKRKSSKGALALAYFLLALGGVSAILVATAGSQMLFDNTATALLTSFSILFYSLIMLAISIFYILSQVISFHMPAFGKLAKTKELTTRIDGKLYLLAMRYSKDAWILMPCSLVVHHGSIAVPIYEGMTDNSGKKQSDTKDLELYYEKNRFIIKRFDELGVVSALDSAVRFMPKGGR